MVGTEPCSARLQARRPPPDASTKESPRRGGHDPRYRPRDGRRRARVDVAPPGCASRDRGARSRRARRAARERGSRRAGRGRPALLRAGGRRVDAALPADLALRPNRARRRRAADRRARAARLEGVRLAVGGPAQPALLPGARDLRSRPVRLEAGKDRPRHAYFPFGFGPRVCIGEAIARLELLVVLAVVAQRFRLVPVPEPPVEPEPGITLRPRHGIRMRVEPAAASGSPAL